MDVPELYSLAAKNNIPVVTYPLPYNGSLSVMDESGSCYIGMDEAVRDGDVLERVHLAHELGHCTTGSFYTIHAPLNRRQRHEYRADKWAIHALVPLEALDDAIAGKTTFAEAAEISDAFQQSLAEMQEKVPPRRDSVVEV